MAGIRRAVFIVFGKPEFLKKIGLVLRTYTSKFAGLLDRPYRAESAFLQLLKYLENAHSRLHVQPIKSGKLPDAVDQ